jgi:hypothetical protein
LLENSSAVSAQWRPGVSAGTSKLMRIRLRGSTSLVVVDRLDLLPLPCMYIFKLVCYIKSHFGEVDQNRVIHNHNTRQKLNLHVQFGRTNVVKNGVMNMGIKLYNRIPNKMTEIGKMSQFKRGLRSYLVQHMFYSVEEYMLS